MTIERRSFTNRAYGFPRGRPRRVRPVALACIHVTGNARAAAMMPPRSAALAEWTYANRPNSNGPSAHDYDDRLGNTIRAIDPLRFAAWSNGDVSDPDMSNAGIRRVLAFRSKGYNVNEAYWLETEEIGHPYQYPITKAQRSSLAHRIAVLARQVGLPINLNTVHGHYQINGINRQNCPWLRSGHDAFMRDIVRRANAAYDTTTARILAVRVRELRKEHPAKARRYRKAHPIPKRETRSERIARLTAEVNALQN